MDVMTIMILSSISIAFTTVFLFAYSASCINKKLKSIIAANIMLLLSCIIMVVRIFHPSNWVLITTNITMIWAVSMQAYAALQVIDLWSKKQKFIYIGYNIFYSVCMIAYILSGSDERIRVTLFAASSCVIIAYPAFKLCFMRGFSFYRRVLGCFYMIATMAMGLRALLSALMPAGMMLTVSHSIGNIATFSALYIYIVAAGTGLVLLVKENDDVMLRMAATIDALTGIMNRANIIKETEKLISFHIRKKQPITFMSMDIDNFKLLNDKFGHQAGDEVLKAFANTISASLREYDLFGRVGGEEFIVILPDTAGEGGYVIAERLRKSIEEMDMEYGRITISIGFVSVVPTQETDFNSLYKISDKAMYEAKNSGRNKIIGGDTAEFSK